MITVAVTGAIGAGKSTVSGLLAARGAIVVDSDRLARQVVEPGSSGLTEIVRQFGADMLTADGILDRSALAKVVFADSTARHRLETITHPLVRARFVELTASAPPGSVVINDIPLLTTAAAAAAFHLVVGVSAPESVRIRRLLDRGMSAQDARARMASQIHDDARRVFCDVWIDNAEEPADVRKRTDLLWSRLAAFASNVHARRVAPRGRPPALVPYDPRWPDIAERLMARIKHVVGVHRLDHIGSTAVPGLPAKDIIDLQLTVFDMAEADALAPALADGGFPRLDEFRSDTPHPGDGDRTQTSEPEADAQSPTGGRLVGWRKTLHCNADPGQRVNLHLRAENAPNWLWALRFRDWLREDSEGSDDYLATKQALAIRFRTDSTVARYAEAKEEFLVEADSRSRSWAAAVGWQPA